MSESPFYNNTSSGKTCILYLEPILNTYYKEYMNVLTVSGIPDGPLNNMVYTIHNEKLSPFQEISVFAGGFPSCLYVLGKYSNRRPVMNDSDSFMMVQDIPAVFSYLENNGYRIDTNYTKIVQRSGVSFGLGSNRLSGNKKMICMFSFC